MVKCESEFIFDYLEDIKNLDFQSTILWIINPHKRPPHLGISSEGFYYSLKYNGKDQGMEVVKFHRLLSSKEIPVIAVKLNKPIPVKEVDKAFYQFSRANSIENSCLKPIALTLKVHGSIKKLADLLVFLKTNDLIKAYYKSKVPSSFDGIPFYSIETIETYLKKLNNVERK